MFQTTNQTYILNVPPAVLAGPLDVPPAASPKTPKIQETAPSAAILPHRLLQPQAVQMQSNALEGSEWFE